MIFEAKARSREVTVVALREAGQVSRLSFTMLPTTPMLKMMAAWCAHNGVPEASVTFVCGQPLRATDTLEALGWAGPVTVHACQTEKSEGEPKHEKSEDASPDKISVRVVAFDEDGRHEVRFKMRQDTCFAKLMETWCENYGIETSEAAFEYMGRSIRKEDTLASLGWSFSMGTPEIEAKPCDQNDKVTVNVVAWGEDGRNVLDFKMRPSTPLGGVFEAWCQHHDISAADVLFTHQGAHLKPQQSPKDLAWKGMLDIEAIPRQLNGGRKSCLARTNSTEQSEISSQSKPTPATLDEKIDIQVVALAEGGENIVDFKMKHSSAFEKMMKAWCKHQGLNEAEAIFEFNGRVLKANDTPEGCGWSRSDGAMKITAKPKEEAPVSSTRAATQGVPATALETAGETSPPVSAASVASSDEKIDIQVVALAEGGENITDFKMKRSSAFEKMMKAWCKHQGLNEAEAIFEFNGRVLKANDTPEGCGWSRSDGAMKITAKPKEEAPVSSTRAATQGVPATALETAGEPSPPVAAASVASSDEKIDIQVVALAEGGENIVDFKMKRGSAFEKMMKAWCKHQGLNEAEAIFEFNGRVLKPNDTPEGCGWSRSDGAMKIAAKPKEEAPVFSTRAATQGVPATVLDTIGETSPPVSAASVASSDEKIDIQVVALAEGGENIVDFKMKHSSAFEKMMKAWCKHQGLNEAEAIFEFNGRVLKANDTPEGCGWSRSDGAMKITAKPKEEAPVSSTRAATQGVPATALETAGETSPPVSAASVASSDEKIDIQVVALAEGGENIVDFKMKHSSAFEKMMKAWCKHQGLNEAEAIFEFNGRVLKANDTPEGCGWSRSDGAMKITAKPKEEAPVSSTRAASQGVPATVLDTIGETSPPVSAASVASSDEKIDIQVVALAEGGENIVDFKMKRGSAFEKMMKAWCKHQGLNEADAIFEFNGRVLGPNDTPEGCGWSCSDGAMKITAKPKEEAPVSSTGSASQGVPATVLDTIGETSPPVSAASVASSDEKISIQVVALAEGGENITDFKMKRSSAFEKMMKAWCKHQGLNEAEAIFEFNGCVLKPNDTPEGCGWSRSDGAMKITAKPKEEAPVSRTGSASQGVPATALDTAGDAIPPVSAASVASSDEKIDIQVVALAEGGENIVDFKMKRGSAFEKMMKAWCKHQGLNEAEAIFEFNGRVLGPNDTPEGCGWSRSDGAMKITAKPKEEAPVSSTGSASQGVPATVLDTMGETSPPVSAASVASSDEKMSIQVVALAEGGENIVDFKMKRGSAFQKMMKAWCKHQGLNEAEAIFEFNGRVLKPNDTPEGCGWSRSDGAMKITAKPKEEAPVSSTCSASQEGVRSIDVSGDETLSVPETANTSLAAAGSGDCSVEVVADGIDGPNIVAFKMRPGTSFGKMMKAWCAHHGVPQEQVCFRLGSRELGASDTPSAVAPGEVKLTVRATPLASSSSAKRPSTAAATSAGPERKAKVRKVGMVQN